MQCTTTMENQENQGCINYFPDAKKGGQTLAERYKERLSRKNAIAEEKRRLEPQTIIFGFNASESDQFRRFLSLISATNRELKPQYFIDYLVLLIREFMGSDICIAINSQIYSPPKNWVLSQSYDNEYTPFTRDITYASNNVLNSKRVEMKVSSVRRLFPIFYESQKSKAMIRGIGQSDYSIGVISNVGSCVLNERYQWVKLDHSDNDLDWVNAPLCIGLWDANRKTDIHKLLFSEVNGSGGIWCQNEDTIYKISHFLNELHCMTEFLVSTNHFTPIMQTSLRPAHIHHSLTTFIGSYLNEECQLLYAMLLHRKPLPRNVTRASPQNTFALDMVFRRNANSHNSNSDIQKRNEGLQINFELQWTEFNKNNANKVNQKWLCFFVLTTGNEELKSWVIISKKYIIKIPIIEGGYPINDIKQWKIVPTKKIWPEFNHCTNGTFFIEYSYRTRCVIILQKVGTSAFSTRLSLFYDTRFDSI